MAHSGQHSARLSIGMPVYNGERYLEETFNCFLAQTFQDFEIIVCDNASTDRTADICRSLAESDPRIRYHRNEKNLGAIRNYNRAFELSRSHLFKWAAHDDLYHPRYLQTCVDILDEDRDVVLAHSRTAFVDDKGEPFPTEPKTGRYVDPRTGVAQTADSPAIAVGPAATVRFWQVLSHARWGTHMFGVMRREVLARTHLVPDFAGGDRAMLAELALLGRFRCSNEALFSKRFHESVSWSLNQKELLGWLNTDGKAYSRRARQLKAYFGAPRGKPVGPIAQAACMTLVAVHSAKTAVQAVTGKEAHNASQGLAWRTDNSISP